MLTTVSAARSSYCSTSFSTGACKRPRVLPGLLLCLGVVKDGATSFCLLVSPTNPPHFATQLGRYQTAVPERSPGKGGGRPAASQGPRAARGRGLQLQPPVARGWLLRQAQDRALAWPGPLPTVSRAAPPCPAPAASGVLGQLRLCCPASLSVAMRLLTGASGTLRAAALLLLLLLVPGSRK